MKKKSTSQSAFFNVRVLIGLCVFITGVFLALVSFGTFSSVFAQTNKTNPQLDSNTMTRQDLVGLYEAIAPADFVPPPCVAGSEMFADVPASSAFCPWIEELSRQGITSGCAPGLFCPAASVTRQQMAVFIVRAIDVGKPDQTILFNTQFVGAFATFNLFSPICPAGTHAVSGGWRADFFPAPVTMTASRPSNGGFDDLSGTNVADRWLVQGINDATAQNYHVSVVCATTRTP
jgi:hypothetical protein